MRYSDYIIYADESGGPSLTPVDPNYPVFVLNFCVFRKDRYAGSVLPAVSAFKFEQFGHDSVVLHERDIRHRNPPFALLHDPPTRAAFMAGLNSLFVEMNVDIIPVVVDKRRLTEQPSDAADLYRVALQLCLEQAHRFLENRGQSARITHVVLESRGGQEDNEMIRAISQNRNVAEEPAKPSARLEIVFADKKTNSAGMQIADLTAGPIGRHYVRPEQANRAWALLEAKLWRDPRASASAAGITIFPE